jgi:hypothetical protein
MSQQARQAVVDSPHTIFQADSQRSDLLDTTKTDSNLIALVQFLLDRGHIIGFTAVNTDHHYDGTTEHSAGLAFDGWPMNSTTPGDWVTDLKPYLNDVAAFPGIRNIGLAGSAYTPDNVAATGLVETQNVESASAAVVFHDDGADHVHHDVHPA